VAQIQSGSGWRNGREKVTFCRDLTASLATRLNLSGLNGTGILRAKKNGYALSA
jgi:hypothetical protein